MAGVASIVAFMEIAVVGTIAESGMVAGVVAVGMVVVGVIMVVGAMVFVDAAKKYGDDYSSPMQL